MRIGDTHGLSEFRLGMRADPSDEEKSAQHHKGLDFGLFLGGECADPPIAPNPRVQQHRHVGTIFEERYRRCAVIEEPGKAAIVEIDDFDRAAVHEQICETHVAVNEIEIGRASCRSGQDAVR